METAVKKTWMPTVAGILDIISGVCGLLVTIFLILGISILSGVVGIFGIGIIPSFVAGLLWVITIPLAIVSILALLGGIYALQRRKWGWVLAGSIAAVFASTPILRALPIGIAAIILAAISKKEFE